MQGCVRGMPSDTANLVLTGHQRPVGARLACRLHAYGCALLTSIESLLSGCGEWREGPGLIWLPDGQL